MQRTTRTVLAVAIGLGLFAGGCAERKTVVRRETETVRQPRIVEEQTVVTPPPSDTETTVIERRRRTTEEER